MSSINLPVEEIVRAWTAVGGARTSIYAQFAPSTPSLPYLIFSSIGTDTATSAAGRARRFEEFEIRVRGAIDAQGKTPIDVYLDFREFVATLIDEMNPPIIGADYGPDLLDQTLLGAMNEDGFIERSFTATASV